MVGHQLTLALLFVPLIVFLRMNKAFYYYDVLAFPDYTFPKVSFLGYKDVERLSIPTCPAKL